MKSGPIIVIEDDVDDKDIFNEIILELSIENEIIWFSNTIDAWNYLKTTTQQPFIIFSDVNLPRQNGIDFKKQVDGDKELREKSIPFVFYSTAVDPRAVKQAYTEMAVQGFFRKATDYEQMKEDIKLILDYWRACKHPNSD
jgi:two-component SAPR family response regulator